MPIRDGISDGLTTFYLAFEGVDGLDVFGEDVVEEGEFFGV